MREACFLELALSFVAVSNYFPRHCHHIFHRISSSLSSGAGHASNLHTFSCETQFDYVKKDFISTDYCRKNRLRGKCFYCRFTLDDMKEKQTLANKLLSTHTYLNCSILYKRNCSIF